MTVAMTALLSERPLLVLHGHEHPGSFEADWEKSATINGRRYWRSNVCSSPRRSERRGLGHRIEWSDAEFTCHEVRGGP